MSVTTDVPTLKDSTIDFIHQLVEDNYHDGDIYEFINTYGEDALVNCYEDYCQFGDDFSYEAVDAFCEEFGVESISHFEDAFYGEYETPAIFAEQLTSDIYNVDVPSFVVIDWDTTWECNLRHDFIWSEGYVFNRNF